MNSLKAFSFFLFSCVLVVGACFFIFDKNNVSKAEQIAEMSGWAWSDNIGWVSLNCKDAGASVCSSSDYRVTVDNSGNLSGWAWSDNIGWIKFDPEGTYPEAPNYSAKIVGGEIKGWIRACVGTIGGECDSDTQSDGWDGWIKLSGSSKDGGSYGLSINGADGKLSGYAWGSDVVGWLSFSGSNFSSLVDPSVVCDFTVDPSSITIIPPATSRPVTVSWECSKGATSPDSLSIDQGIGTVTVKGSQTVNISKSTDLNLTITKFGISKKFSVNVNAVIYKIDTKEVIPE